MVKPEKVPQNWDGYICQIEGKRGYISLNLALIDHAPIPKATALYSVDFQFLEPGEHGTGTKADADLLFEITDSLNAWAVKAKFFVAGRTRSDGAWIVYYYGIPGQKQVLLEVLSQTLVGTGRRYRVSEDSDPDWRTYREFLYPNEERLQWMGDCSVVESLTRNGDQHEIPRMVDHSARFDRQSDRDAFMQGAAALGYQPAAGADHSVEADGTCSAFVERMETIELEKIHTAVMELYNLALLHNGEYDGWGCIAQKPEHQSKTDA